MKKTKLFIISILIPLAVGGLSAWLTRGNMNVYSEINKPALSPPGIVFPIAWGILYVLMGISSGIVYKRRNENPEASSALIIYGLQLVVNFFWSIIFFNMQAYLFSFIWLVLLFILIVMMILQFYKIDKKAAYLQIPYALWVCFAGYLNFMIYLLN